MRSRRGFTLIELLTGLLLMSLVGLAAFKTYGTIVYVRDRASFQSLSNKEVRKVLETLASHLRNAQLCEDGSMGIVDSVLGAASGNSITYYTDGVGNTVRYFHQGTELLRTSDGNTTTVARGLQFLSLTYCKTGLYNGTWVPTMDPSAPTAGELPYVVAVVIKARTVVEGVATQQTTTVRLRNSPKKSTL